jgi:hypothetical protein
LAFRGGAGMMTTPLVLRELVERLIDVRIVLAPSNATNSSTSCTSPVSESTKKGLSPVDEQLLNEAMRLPHAEPLLVAPACVQLAELIVLVGHDANFSRSELVLTPEQLDGDAGARQLRGYPVSKSIA